MEIDLMQFPPGIRAMIYQSTAMADTIHMACPQQDYVDLIEQGGLLSRWPVLPSRSNVI